MIEFQNVNYIVKDGTIDKEIIKDISFKLPSCGMVVLSGKSGSGKTTILNLITNTIKKSSGKIFFDGHDYDTKKRSEIDLIRKNDISVVYQNEGLIEDLTIEENLKVCLCAKGIAFSDVKGLYEQYIEMLGLSMCLNTKAYNLSGGERVRVRILQAIIVEPKVLILDEPTASLDLENSKIVMEFLNSIKDKILIVLSTHDLELLDGYEYSIIKINYGRIEYINILDTTLNQKDELKRGKTNIKYISKKVFRQKNIRVVLNTVLLFVSMCFFLITCIFSTFSSGDFWYESYHITNYDTYIISNSSIESLIYNNINYSIIENEGNKMYEFAKNSKLKYRKYYYDYLNKDFLGIGENMVIDESYSDYEIGITDYSLNELKKNNILKTKSGLNETITIDNTNFIIKKIIKTNYKWYNKLSNAKKEEKEAYKEVFYKNVYMNYKTASEMDAIINKSKTVIYNNEKYCVMKVSDLEEGMYSGSKELQNDNEILITTSFIKEYYKEEVTSSNIYDYIGKHIEYCGRDYIIKGACILRGIVCTENEYKTYQNTISPSSKEFISTTLSDKKGAYELKDFLETEYLNVDIISPFDNDISDIYMVFRTLKKISLFLSVISLIFILVSSLFLINDLLKINIRSIGILKSFGLSNSNICLLMFKKLFKIVLMVMIPSIAITIAVYIGINMEYIVGMPFDHFIIKFNYLFFALYILATLMSVYIIYKVFINMAMQRTINDLIKGKE